MASDFSLITYFGTVGGQRRFWSGTRIKVSGGMAESDRICNTSLEKRRCLFRFVPLVPLVPLTVERNKNRVFLETRRQSAMLAARSHASFPYYCLFAFWMRFMLFIAGTLSDAPGGTAFTFEAVFRIFSSSAGLGMPGVGVAPGLTPRFSSS